MKVSTKKLIAEILREAQKMDREAQESDALRIDSFFSIMGKMAKIELLLGTKIKQGEPRKR